MTEDRSAEPLKRQLGELQQLVEQKNAQIHSLHAKIRGYDTLGMYFNQLPTVTTYCVHNVTYHLVVFILC